LFDELKLRKQTTFFNSGISISKSISDYYDEKENNQVALIIIDYKMPGMDGVELIKWTREYLKKKRVEPEDMPHFAFRAQ
jgi:CheY-like chemotaxis protein